MYGRHNSSCANKVRRSATIVVLVSILGTFAPYTPSYFAHAGYRLKAETRPDFLFPESSYDRTDSNSVRFKNITGSTYRGPAGRVLNWVRDSKGASGEGRFCISGVCIHYMPPVVTIDTERTPARGGYNYKITSNFQGRFSDVTFGRYDVDMTSVDDENNYIYSFLAGSPCGKNITPYSFDVDDSTIWSSWNRWYGGMFVPQKLVDRGGMIMSSGGLSCALKLATKLGNFYISRFLVEPEKRYVELRFIEPPFHEIKNNEINLKVRVENAHKLKIQFDTSFWRSYDSGWMDISGSWPDATWSGVLANADPTDTQIRVSIYNNNTGKQDSRQIVVKGKSSIQCMGEGVAATFTDWTTYLGVGTCTLSALGSNPDPLIKIAQATMCLAAPSVRGLQKGLDDCGKDSSPGTPEGCMLASANALIGIRLPSSLNYLPYPASKFANLSLAETIGAAADFIFPGSSMPVALASFALVPTLAYGACTIDKNFAKGFTDVINNITRVAQVLKTIEDIIYFATNIAKFFEKRDLPAPTGSGAVTPAVTPTVDLSKPLELGSLIVGRGCEFLSGKPAATTDKAGIHSLFQSCNQLITSFAVCGSKFLGTNKYSNGKAVSKGGELDNTHAEEFMRRQRDNYGQDGAARFQEAIENADRGGQAGLEALQYVCTATSDLNAMQDKLQYFVERFAPIRTPGT